LPLILERDVLHRLGIAVGPLSGGFVGFGVVGRLRDAFNILNTV